MLVAFLCVSVSPCLRGKRPLAFVVLRVSVAQQKKSRDGKVTAPGSLGFGVRAASLRRIYPDQVQRVQACACLSSYELPQLAESFCVS
jgi:hypothetical protein